MADARRKRGRVKNPGTCYECKKRVPDLWLWFDWWMCPACFREACE